VASKRLAPDHTTSAKLARAVANRRALIYAASGDGRRGIEEVGIIIAPDDRPESQESPPVLGSVVRITYITRTTGGAGHRVLRRCCFLGTPVS
jgi:hypothetical protein